MVDVLLKELLLILLSDLQRAQVADGLLVDFLDIAVASLSESFLELVAHCWHADAGVESSQVELIPHKPLILLFDQSALCFDVLFQWCDCIILELFNVKGLLFQLSLHRLDLLLEETLLVLHRQCELPVLLLKIEVILSDFPRVFAIVFDVLDVQVHTLQLVLQRLVLRLQVSDLTPQVLALFHHFIVAVECGLTLQLL